MQRSSSSRHRHHQQMVGRRYYDNYMVGSTPETLNTITPCAACKLLRRRCAQECPFSPYFSPHEPHKFACVHKVYGASNVSKLLMVPESRRADAANSLVYEANVRLRDPVYGCMGAISALQQQVHSLQAELDLVRAEIIQCSKYFRESHHHTPILVPSHSYLVANLLSSKSGVVSVSAPVPTVLQPSSPPLPPHPPILLTSSSSFFYAPVSTACDYSTISNENIPYFG
ncbi:hypothetical protein RHSIM_Rhsim09G0183600 [Rhododendron simsii]|uniref:LOB domain-containing protein n=1 Tax=Rhododendron simsii TaxID=118357 RepID=A0A834GDE7_RHOSS|nr:hypothetical protein RHSIM_Rhsim09G0183600 [Rhododendron simsii]